MLIYDGKVVPGFCGKFSPQYYWVDLEEVKSGTPPPHFTPENPTSYSRYMVENVCGGEYLYNASRSESTWFAVCPECLPDVKVRLQKGGVLW